MKNISKGINFIPDFVIENKKKRKRIIMVIIGTTILTLLAFAAYYLPNFKMFYLDIDLRNINADLSILEDVKDIKKELEDIQSKVNKKKEILNEISKDEVDIIILMDKLNEAAPSNVVLTYFASVGKGSINVSYIINNPIEATQLVSNLRALALFEEVKMPVIPIVDRQMPIKFSLKLKEQEDKK